MSARLPLSGLDELPQPVRPRLMPHARSPWSLPAVVLAGALVANVFATMLVPAAAQAQSTGATQRKLEKVNRELKELAAERRKIEGRTAQARQQVRDVAQLVGADTPGHAHKC